MIVLLECTCMISSLCILRWQCIPESINDIKNRLQQSATVREENCAHWPKDFFWVPLCARRTKRLPAGDLPYRLFFLFLPPQRFWEESTTLPHPAPLPHIPTKHRISLLSGFAWVFLQNSKSSTPANKSLHASQLLSISETLYSY